jgi:hypothetical protein
MVRFPAFEAGKRPYLKTQDFGPFFIITPVVSTSHNTIENGIINLKKGTFNQRM